MSTRSTIAIKMGSKYKSIYCHNDGYPEGVGTTLNNYWTNTTKIKKLIALGDISYISKQIGTKHNFDNPPKGEVNAYGRDRGETNISARISNNFEGLMEQASNQGTEYLYVWEGKKWNDYKVN